MKQASHPRQRGQALTEFLVGMLALLPIILGVIYLGKYEDMKYSAEQASRYVAFERVFDPTGAHKPTATVLAQETRERFFRDPMEENNGAVGFQDSTAALTTQTSLGKNWFGTAGEALISAFSGIGVSVNSSAPSNTGAALDALAKANFNISDPGIEQGAVQVPIVTPSYFSDLTGKNLALNASTYVLADGYNADGDGAGSNPASNTVRARAGYDWGLVLGKVPGLQSALNAVTGNVAAQFGWEALSDSPGPQFGCISPDVVPTDAVSSTAKYGATNSNPCPAN
jgi:hypothetical protein